MLRISCLPSSMAALHNISRVSLIFTTVLLILNSEKMFYYWLEVKFAYLVDFCPIFFLWFAPHFTFLFVYTNTLRIIIFPALVLFLFLIFQ